MDCALCRLPVFGAVGTFRYCIRKVDYSPSERFIMLGAIGGLAVPRTGLGGRTLRLSNTVAAFWDMAL